tara:strand:- start:704 stop:1327 length:624 start_codon:yes stop_codon:yes gene_type:complete
MIDFIIIIGIIICSAIAVKIYRSWLKTGWLLEIGARYKGKNRWQEDAFISFNHNTIGQEKPYLLKRFYNNINNIQINNLRQHNNQIVYDVIIPNELIVQQMLEYFNEGEVIPDFISKTNLKFFMNIENSNFSCKYRFSVLKLDFTNDSELKDIHLEKFVLDNRIIKNYNHRLNNWKDWGSLSENEMHLHLAKNLYEFIFKKYLILNL